MPTYSDTPTASQIQRRTRHLSDVAHTEQATVQYYGTAVRWYVRFFNALPIDGAILQFAFDQRGFHLPAHGSTTVYALVDPANFPGFLDLRRSQRLTLCGRVQKVDSLLGITIELDQAVIVPRSFWDYLIGFFNRGPS